MNEHKNALKDIFNGSWEPMLELLKSARSVEFLIRMASELKANDEFIKAKTWEEFNKAENKIERDDVDTADVDENLKPIFKYLKKLTLAPTKMVQSDADAVFNAGWSERALYDAIIISCTWSFMNRFVEGLGLSVIPEHFGMEGKMLHAGYTKIYDHFELK